MEIVNTCKGNRFYFSNTVAKFTSIEIKHLFRFMYKLPKITYDL